jgi:hypothetical protein
LAAAILAVVLLSQNVIKATPPSKASAGNLNNHIGSKNNWCRPAGNLLPMAGYKRADINIRVENSYHNHEGPQGEVNSDGDSSDDQAKTEQSIE